MSTIIAVGLIVMLVSIVLGMIAIGQDEPQWVAVMFFCLLASIALVLYGAYRDNKAVLDRCAERCDEFRHVSCGTLSHGRHNDEEREYSVCETIDGGYVVKTEKALE